MRFEVPDKLKPFECHGVDFSRNSGGQFVADCPFCGNPKHFYANGQTGQWDCKKCPAEGNVITFLSQLAEMYHADTASEDWLALAKVRGIPVHGLKRWGLGWDGEQWLIPARSTRGTVRDIRRWVPGNKAMRSTTGCQVQLFGADRIKKMKEGRRIWVCEGEWDAIALEYVLRKGGRPYDAVVAVPGANTFKPEWAGYLADSKASEIILCYDNDNAGDQGAAKAWDRLQGCGKALRWVNWPEVLEKGFDVRDFVCKGLHEFKVKPKTIYQHLRKICLRRHERADVPPEEVEPTHAEQADPAEAPAFGQVLETFEKWLAMDRDSVIALKLMLAVALSGSVPGDPLWLFIVAPPGGGKTALLSSLRDSPRTVFKSTITPRTLVSGFKASPDPSLLPTLHQKCLVWKDFTELLSMRPDDRAEIWSTLRGAYDGDVEKSFGNGVTRRYRDISFAMLAGVTPKIHADRQPALGERFLKFQMHRSAALDDDAQIRAAIRNMTKENEMDAELREVAARFLAQRVDPRALPRVPDGTRDRMLALGQLISVLRADVEREFRNDSIRYRPQPEVPTRLLKQLLKLGRMLAIVEGKSTVDEPIAEILERVAFDSAIGFHLEIVQAVMMLGPGATRKNLREHCGLPASNLGRILADLEMLGVLRRERGRGPKDPKRGPVSTKPPDLWKVAKRVAGLWERARVGQVHVKRSVAVRRRRRIRSKRRTKQHPGGHR